MGTRSGQSDSSPVFVTREVRWFGEGPLPPEVLDWFTGATTFHTETRVDVYDVDAAEEGIGRKQRDTSSLDSKVRVHITQNVTLAPGLRGHVEDWLKVSRPLNGVSTYMSNPLEVHKHLRTRRFALDGRDETGCEVELAEITVGPVESWSLCFETFGVPADREDALRIGVDRLVSDRPWPEGFELDSGSSLAYPDWIRLVARGRAVAVS